MKILTTYRFEEEDPCWQRRIDESFNRVLNFAPELQAPPLNATRREQKDGRHPTLVSLRRIVNGEFCQNQIVN